MSYLQKCEYEYHEHKIEDFAKEIARVDGSPSSALLQDMIERRVPLSIFKDILKHMKHIPALEALGVREKPSITIEPSSSYKKYEGESLKIEFKAYAIPKPSYQWYKRYDQDWRRKNDRQSRPDLVIEKVSIEDRGEYKCQVVNEKGEAYTRGVVIHVIPVRGIGGCVGKPRIPSDLTVFEHTPLTIEAELDSFNKAWSCIWYRNPKQVMHSGHELAHYLPDQTALCLHISSAALDCAGFYYCCIFNNYDSTEKFYSDPCLVTVIPSDYNMPMPITSYGSEDPTFSSDMYYHRQRQRSWTETNPPTYRDEFSGSSYFHHFHSVDAPDLENNTGDTLGPRHSSNTSTKPAAKFRSGSPSTLEIEEDVVDRPEEGIIKETPIDDIVHLKHFQAEQDPVSTFQWYFIPFNQPNGAPEAKEKWTKLEHTFKILTKDFYGSYFCVQTLCNSTKRYSLWTKVCPPASDKCRDKVALLVGNQKYREQVFTLHLPESDTRDLAGRLRSLGFRVVTLVNLNSKDMRIAIKNYVKLLNTGVYALFYYGGHGFEKDGENYLMGVESSREYKIEHCIDAKWIREQMASRNAKLNMMILDMCRTKIVTSQNASSRPQPMINPELDNAPHIIAYSCSPSCQAFERPADENSIYMTQLLKCIGDPVRVENLLLEVSKRVSEVGKESEIPDFKWMHPFFKTNLNEEFTLHDPIDTDNPYKKDYDLIAERWHEVYECPSKQILQSDDGDIAMRLHFDAEHSNVLLIGVEKMVGPLTQTEILSLKLEVFHNWPTCVESYSVTCEDLDELICPGALIPQVRNLLARYRIPDLQLFKYGMRLVFTVVYQVEDNTIEKQINYIPDPPPLYAKLIYGQDTY